MRLSIHQAEQQQFDDNSLPLITSDKKTMADRATGGAGKPPLYKIVMLGDSGVGKTSLGMFYELMLLFVGDERNFLTVQFFILPHSILSCSSYKP